MFSLEISSRLSGINIRNIYVVDEYSCLPEDVVSASTVNDVFFTYDFKLKKNLEDKGLIVFFLDHILDQSYLQDNNFIFYHFFENWFKDVESKDIFVYKNIPFGFSFRLDVWNDLVLYVKKHLCLRQVSMLPFEQIFVLSADSSISKILSQLNVAHVNTTVVPAGQYFYFPITKWLSERLEPTGVRKFLYKARSSLNILFSYVSRLYDKFLSKADVVDVFFQEYHPTKDVLSSLRKDPLLRLHLVNFSRSSTLTEKLNERVVPVNSSFKTGQHFSHFIDCFRQKRVSQLILANGDDVSECAYSIIEQRVMNSIAEKLNVLDSCISYIDSYNFKLQVLISNIGLVTTLFDCVCKEKGIPSYLIINGLFGPEYSDDSKFATYINSYSESIKNNYFNGAENIYVLGDPRMDIYSKVEQRVLNVSKPKIIIGASGYNNVDLNSYVAVEFDFLHDILTAITKHITIYGPCDICIKVRPNGYIQQYRDFVAIYFPDLAVEFQDTKPMFDVLKEAGLYISLYSQTLFEASCLGVPVIYYKKDTEILTQPFDGKSELVTANTVVELIDVLKAFRDGTDIFESFLKKSVMEKYVGPLDGNNTKRNVEFIYNILKNREV